MNDVTIDCGSCAVRGLACDDCVVSVLLDRDDDSLTFDRAEQDAVSALWSSGLVPPLRLVPKRRRDTPGQERAAG